MAELLAVGKEFKSFEALQDAVYQYEQSCFAQLSRTDSRTIENEEARRSSKLFNPNIKYSFVTFTCAFGGKPYVSRSTGIRNSKPRIKCNCPVILKCFASSDGQKLVVRVSSLDCHNHDTSEESFKALPRGRLLDEETEQEIYLLIDSHENKKLARKLVKEKLIEETGRDITYKDIQNIEKRMSKRRGNGDRNGRTEDEDSDDASMHSDQEEDEENKEENAGDQSLDNDEQGSSPDKKDAKGQKTQNSPKKKGKTTAVSTPSTQTRSTGRPRREIREPTRFRDPSLKVSSSVLKRRASESDNSWEDSDSEMVVKKEPQSGRRGRPKGSAKKVKLATPEIEEGGRLSDEGGSDTEQLRVKKEKESTLSTLSVEDVSKTVPKENRESLASRQLDMEERRLKIQEEMLNLQRQSMLLLQNVVLKLERVEANQKTEENTKGCSGDASVAALTPVLVPPVDENSKADVVTVTSNDEQSATTTSSSITDEQTQSTKSETQPETVVSNE